MFFLIMDLLYIAFNTIIFIQYADLLSLWGITRKAEKFILAYFLLMVQIIATLLFLGTIGCLFLLPAIMINSIIILSISYFSRPPRLSTPPASGWGMWKVILSPLSNKLIAGCSVLVLGWLLLCAYFIPPRVVDEITYHLPFIFESIQRGRWALLPTDLRIHFAYPMNAEVLYSWPVLFFKDTRWGSASQIPMGVWTSGMIYLFSRHFGLRRSKAFLLAGMFFLTPIVIAQMGTDYIDLTSAGFLLCSLYLTMRFLTSSRKIYVRLAFLSIGTMMGIKYHLLFWGIILALILFFILIRKKWKADFLWGLIAVIGLGLGWHIRNYLLFSDWAYPARATASFWEISHQSAGGTFISILNKIGLIFIKDINNGTEDGGFGRFYGFIIFFIWITGGWIFLFRKNIWKKGEILFFGIALSFLLLLIPIGNDVFPWIGPRMLLVAWPIYLLIFGRISFVLIKKPGSHQLLITLFFLGFLLDVLPVLNSRTPHHHWWGKPGSSQFESFRYSGWYVGRLGPCASILDTLTQSLPRRATVYLAAPAGEFFSAPFYGSFLQTQIVNFDPQFKGDPDFLVYLTISPEPLVYIGNFRKTLPEAIFSGYKVIFSRAPYGTILANPRVLSKIIKPSNGVI